ncbi:enamelin [Antennarius striatus]|uniref:enamelin n=1 Tax=Antennarius striatus TaxID=241820 RepID=UPI0035B2DAC1
MMKLLVCMMCLMVTTLAAPAQESESNEVAAHANLALKWMEMYRMYQQQGVVGNPFLPAADAPVVAAPVQSFDVPPPAPVIASDASEEETEEGDPAPKAAAPVGPAGPLNSDEEEEAETEEVEAAEPEPPVTEAAPADPAVEPAAEPAAPAAEPAGDPAAADAGDVAVPPVDVVPIDIFPAVTEVANDAADPAIADAPVAVDAGAAQLPA